MWRERGGGMNGKVERRRKERMKRRRDQGTEDRRKEGGEEREIRREEGCEDGRRKGRTVCVGGETGGIFLSRMVCSWICHTRWRDALINCVGFFEAVRWLKNNLI